MSISHEEWCWKLKSVEVEVLDSDTEGVEFRQTGYMLRCSLSHAITLVRAFPQTSVKISVLAFIFTSSLCNRDRECYVVCVFVLSIRNSFKMAANLRMLGSTICQKESIASACLNQVSVMICCIYWPFFCLFFYCYFFNCWHCDIAPYRCVQSDSTFLPSVWTGLLHLQHVRINQNWLLYVLQLDFYISYY